MESWLTKVVRRIFKRDQRQQPDTLTPPEGPRSALCQSQMRDVFTVIYSFVLNPGPLRVLCAFTRHCWAHAIYLEGLLPCPYYHILGGASSSTEDEKDDSGDGEEGEDEEERKGIPILWNNIPKLDKRYCCKLYVTKMSQVTVLKGYSLNQSPRHKATVLEDDGILDLGPGVQQLQVASLPSLTRIRNYFLHGCTFLKHATFQDLPALLRVGKCWLYGCASLESIHLCSLPCLESVGDSFLHDSTSLKHATFRDLPALAMIGSKWLFNCTSLESIQLAGLPCLKVVGDHFLYGCTALKHASFQHLPALNVVGSHWMSDCKSLSDVTFKNVPKLTNLGNQFLDGCSMKFVTFAVAEDCHSTVKAAVQEQ